VKNTYAISITSIRSNIRRVEQFILGLKREIPLDNPILDRILISVTEAVNNGIVHGNRLQADKRVHVVCSVCPDRLVFSVRDEGAGFDPEDVPDPLQEENLLKEGGRGIHIIRSLMDSVVFHRHDDGMEIVMTVLTQHGEARVETSEGG
jgi:serine/threonine-protein kinase RsbW